MLQSIFNLDSFPLFFSFPFMAAVGTVGLVWLGGKYLYHSHSCPATRIPMKDASTQTECVTHDINENEEVQATPSFMVDASTQTALILSLTGMMPLLLLLLLLLLHIRKQM